MGQIFGKRPILGDNITLNKINRNDYISQYDTILEIFNEDINKNSIINI